METKKQVANRLYYQANKERLDAVKAARRKVDPEARRAQDRDWYARNAKSVLERNKAYRESNPEKIRELDRLRYKKHRLSLLARKKKERLEHPERLALRYKKWYANRTDLVRLGMNCRARISKAIRRGKIGPSFHYLGCTIECLVLYLESRFLPGMTWENYGQWHVDHVIAIASAKSQSELESLLFYKNLQPLWACDNLKKGSRGSPNPGSAGGEHSRNPVRCCFSGSACGVSRSRKGENEKGQSKSAGSFSDPSVKCQETRLRRIFDSASTVVKRENATDLQIVQKKVI